MRRRPIKNVGSTHIFRGRNEVRSAQGLFFAAKRGSVSQRKQSDYTPHPHPLPLKGRGEGAWDPSRQGSRAFSLWPRPQTRRLRTNLPISKVVLPRFPSPQRGGGRGGVCNLFVEGNYQAVPRLPGRQMISRGRVLSRKITTGFCRSPWRKGRCSVACFLILHGVLANSPRCVAFSSTLTFPSQLSIFNSNLCSVCRHSVQT